jgi:predicted CopG family antitoxin
MAKKITISVPDELHEKMQEWKKSLNFSRIFQEAVSDLIQKKEDFNRRLKEDPKMSEIIERLRKEKQESETEWFDQGKQDGTDWAKSSHYSEIKEALDFEFENGWPNSKAVGEHLEHLRNDTEPEDEYYQLFGDNRWELSESGLKYLEGFKKGILEFWDEIKNKL